jgi:hypothetical protein
LLIAPYVGTWNNVTSHPAQIKPGGGNGSLHWWSEVDLDLGATATYKQWTLGLNYIFYSYPNGSIAQDMEAGFALSYDDSDTWKNNTVFNAINPHLAYYHEIQNLGGHVGGYMELGIEPTLKPFNIGSLPVTPWSEGHSSIEVPVG